MPRWHYNEETEEFHGDDLYFIQEGEDGPIKIGRGAAEARLKALQTGNARQLRILATLPQTGYAENFWHKAFAQFRLRGEWFEQSAPLLTAIRWAVRDENWADEVPAPEGYCQYHYSELMLDAWDIFQDLLWQRVAESKAADEAMSYVSGHLWGLENCPPEGCDRDEQEAQRDAAFERYAVLINEGRAPA